MGNSSLRLNISICGVNQRNERLINKLFPQIIQENKRKLEENGDNIFYTAKIFRGVATTEFNLNRIKNYINTNYDNVQNNKKVFPKNIILYFSDENETLQQNMQNWTRFANRINTLPEVKIPFINFLGYGDINEIRDQVQIRNPFRDFKDRRKITILRLLNNDNENDRETNYRKILSYLWEMALILNQKPFRLSKNPKANYFKIKEETPAVSINILLTGFSRKGKSTYINMIFDKMVTLENPSLLPVTSEITEFLLPSQPDENQIVKGGLKIFDVPGLIEGTSENMSNIIKMMETSIKNQEVNFDVINYILFFLTPGANFANIDYFLKKLDESKIKIIFIINRDKPKEDGMPNTTKETLIDFINGKGFNNLLQEDSSNIIEVDLIKGVGGRTNEIFRYIHDDLVRNNNFGNNVENEINNLNEQQLFPYLHNNLDLFSKITSTENLIERGNKRANLIKAGTIPLIIAAGFSPIPLIDIPIFVFLTALMLINIFKAYCFNINIQIFSNFFRNLNGGNALLIAENNDEIAIRRRIFGLLERNFENINDEKVRFIIRQLIKILEIRIGTAAFLSILDLIPGGFVIGGIINALINAPFFEKVVEDAKSFLINQIRANGVKPNIINIIKGYRDSAILLENLSNNNDWSRKIRILND